MIFDHVRFSSLEECFESLSKHFPKWNKYYTYNTLYNMCVSNYNIISEKWNVNRLFTDCCIIYDANGVLLPLMLVEKDDNVYYFDNIDNYFYPYNRDVFALVPDEDRFILYKDEKGLPLWYKDESCLTFESYMRKHRKDYVKMFFGEKSKRVSWHFCSLYSEEYQKLLPEICNLWKEHCKFIMGKPSTDGYWETSDEPWHLDLDTVAIAYAKDEELNKIVCAVQLRKSGDVGGSGYIGMSHDDKYRQYALCIASLYYALNYFFYIDKNVNFVDLGWNGGDLGNYKKDLVDEYAPVYTFSDFKFEDLDSFIKRSLDIKPVFPKDDSYLHNIAFYNIENCVENLSKHFPNMEKSFLRNELHYSSASNAQLLNKPLSDACLCCKVDDILIPLKANEKDEGTVYFDTMCPYNLGTNREWFSLIDNDNKFKLYENEKAIPVVYKDDFCATFESYMRKHRKSYIAILFGEKSKRIKWNFCSVYSEEYRKLLPEICKLWTEHCNYVMDKAVDKELNWGTSADFWHLDTHIDSIVYAIDVESNELVCVEQLGSINGVGCCGFIGFSHDIKYKPYSLCISSLYQALNYFFYLNNNYKEVDLGWNGDELGNYKKDMVDEFVPVYTLNDVSADEWEWLKNRL